MGFYKTTCPDAEEKIIFGIVEKKFKEDPGTATGLLRLVFHDCFANVTRRLIITDALVFCYTHAVGGNVTCLRPHRLSFSVPVLYASVGALQGCGAPTVEPVLGEGGRPQHLRERVRRHR
jgi:hypothetical protein